MASQAKFVDHLWYLSERLVPFCLFSETTTIAQKQNVRVAMLKCKEEAAGENMCIPSFSSEKSDKYQLQDFVGPDSWTFFKLISANLDNSATRLSFIDTHPSTWSNNEDYKIIKMNVDNLPVVNDAAERALGLLTEFNQQTLLNDEEQKQYVYKVVKELRNQQTNIVKGSERVTKQTISSINFDSI